MNCSRHSIPSNNFGPKGEAMSESIDQARFNAKVRDAYRTLEDPVEDLYRAGLLCRLAILDVVEEGFACEPGEIHDDRLDDTKRQFVLEEDEFSMLHYAVHHLVDLVENLHKQHNDLWEKSRSAAMEGDANG
jgi:hypothetical protein